MNVITWHSTGSAAMRDVGGICSRGEGKVGKPCGGGLGRFYTPALV
jgi:hypothetical protein